LRVLLLTDAEVFAGTERHIFDLANGLQDEGVEAWIASPSPSILLDRSKAAGLKHIVVQKRGLIDRAAIATLSALLRRREIDIVHAHNGRTMLSAAIAVVTARKGCAIATQHFIEPDHAARTGPKATMYRAAHRWVSSRLSCYVAISAAVRDAMLARREAPPHRIHIVHNGMPPIDAGRLSAPEDVRRMLNVPMDHKLIVCAARLEHEKDTGTLISAMAEITNQQSNITCLIAGAGSLYAQLTEDIKLRSLDSSVRLLGFRDDVLSLIGACDLFVLPSLAEPFGLVLLEAMALSKPVIATNAGGPREIVADGSTGLLVPPGDPLAMAHAIRSLMIDRSRMETMGKLGNERFQESFTVRQMAQGMHAVYNSAVQSYNLDARAG
jgi:glycosyltransferase involved in cell wall biosynthesis